MTTSGVTISMAPTLEYKLTSTCQNAQTPAWLLDMLKSEHGALHDPCPHSPFEDGLYTSWSFTQVNFVDSPFNHAKHWLLKAADKAQQHKHSLVLTPFRPHTRYMWEALQHAASVCVLSKPIRFASPDDKQFGTLLPTPVRLLSFGADLAPSARHSVTTSSFARLRSCDASLNNIKQMVLQCTGTACEIVGSPISGGTLRVAATEYSSATLCTVKMTKKKTDTKAFSCGTSCYLPITATRKVQWVHPRAPLCRRLLCSILL
jgi:hypothetical protein